MTGQKRIGTARRFAGRLGKSREKAGNTPHGSRTGTDASKSAAGNGASVACACTSFRSYALFAPGDVLRGRGWQTESSTAGGNAVSRQQMRFI